MHSVATKPSQVVSINSFIAQQMRLHPEFIGFATLHPYMDDLQAEVERAEQLGLRGIKLHPDFQAFTSTSPGRWPFTAPSRASCPCRFIWATRRRFLRACAPGAGAGQISGPDGDRRALWRVQRVGGRQGIPSGAGRLL